MNEHRHAADISAATQRALQQLQGEDFVQRVRVVTLPLEQQRGPRNASRRLLVLLLAWSLGISAALPSVDSLWTIASGWLRAEQEHASWRAVTMVDWLDARPVQWFAEHLADLVAPSTGGPLLIVLTIALGVAAAAILMGRARR